MKSQLTKAQRAYFIPKRIFDIIVSFFAIILLFPLLLVLAIGTKCSSKGPIFFKQKRVGKREKLFMMLKFRSMHADAKQIAPKDMSPEEQSSMITKWGRFLRRSSLDELPQLFNIFAGSMSFIGPRPSQDYEHEGDLIDERRSYLPSPYEVKPGLTGYAQIHTERAHDVKQKSRGDAYYVRHFGFRLDCRIFFKSLGIFLGLHPGR